MFRIKAHKVGDTIYLKSGRFSKKIKIGVGLGYDVLPEASHNIETVYQFTMKCRELCRDRLYLRHGKKGCTYEQAASILKSTVSAYKRMKSIS